MRIAQGWQDYEILDTYMGEKLERWGEIILIRPDPQVIWAPKKSSPLWSSPHAHYHRSSSGGGHWETKKAFPESQIISYGDLKFKVMPTNFKHMGLFPEQAVNWDYYMDKISSQNRTVNALNLFSYTGGATLALAKAGAKVAHVDASKGMVSWARENATLSGLQDNPIRWLVDDCLKFVEREIRRGNKYDVIIMDPPSYGRGPGGEIWKIEDSIFQLVSLCSQILSDNPLFFVLNSYTTGLSPSVMAFVLGTALCPKFGGKVSCDEIGIPVTSSSLPLPLGNTAIWEA